MPMRLALAASSAVLMAGSSSPSPKPAQTVVLELFQSQGCSSCPPALASLARVADRPGVIALSFAVTYWDGLGWKDGFATPAYTARQWNYAHRNARAQVATPQLWVDGRYSINGGNFAEVERAVDGAAALPGPLVTLAATAAGGSAMIGTGHAPDGGAGHPDVGGTGHAPEGGADVWLVRYDPRTIPVPIHAGENGGRTLLHRDVVRALTKLGRWTGEAQRYPIPRAGDPHWRTAVLVQAGAGGPIVAAAAA